MLFYFFQLYEINDDPKRKEFLDDLFSFMQKRGKSIQPVVHTGNTYIVIGFVMYIRLTTVEGPLRPREIHPRILNPSLLLFTSCSVFSEPRLESHHPAPFIQMFLGENYQRRIWAGCLQMSATDVMTELQFLQIYTFSVFNHCSNY
jgi:hypothetical protein